MLIKEALRSWFWNVELLLENNRNSTLKTVKTHFKKFQNQISQPLEIIGSKNLEVFLRAIDIKNYLIIPLNRSTLKYNAKIRPNDKLKKEHWYKIIRMGCDCKIITTFIHGKLRKSPPIEKLNYGFKWRYCTLGLVDICMSCARDLEILGTKLVFSYYEDETEQKLKGKKADWHNTQKQRFYNFERKLRGHNYTS